MLFQESLEGNEIEKISDDFYARHYTVKNGLFCSKSRYVCCDTIMYVVVLLCNIM